MEGRMEGKYKNYFYISAKLVGSCEDDKIESYSKELSVMYHVPVGVFKVDRKFVVEPHVKFKGKWKNILHLDEFIVGIYEDHELEYYLNDLSDYYKVDKSEFVIERKFIEGAK